MQNSTHSYQEELPAQQERWAAKFIMEGSEALATRQCNNINRNQRIRCFGLEELGRSTTGVLPEPKSYRKRGDWGIVGEKLDGLRPNQRVECGNDQIEMMRQFAVGIISIVVIVSRNA